MKNLLFFLLSLTGSIAAAEPAVVLKDSELRSKPLGDAEVLQTLKASSAVNIMSRQGAWANVQATAGNPGWTRLLNLRTSSAQSGDSGIGVVASLFKTGSSGNTVSTGVKGLSEADLRQASPNAAEANRLDQYKTSEGDAKQFARSGGLAPQSVNYLDK
jgi:uncharacterized protein YgiM (DUF1202 family)